MAIINTGFSAFYKDRTNHDQTVMGNYKNNELYEWNIRM